MATLLEKIDVISEKINKNTNILAKDERGLASQAILDDLRDLVEHTAVLIHAGQESEIGFDLIKESLEYIRKFSKYSFLYKLHNRLNLGISHYEPNESDAEMLMLSYMHNLFLIKKFYIEKYNHHILQDLQNYPLNLDPGLSDYYKAIIEKIKSEDYERITDRADFYLELVFSKPEKSVKIRT